MYQSQLPQKTPDHLVSIPCILQVCRYYAGIKSLKLWQVKLVMLKWKTLPGQKFVKEKINFNTVKIGIIMKMEPRRESLVFQQKETVPFYRIWKTSSFRLFAFYDVICCICSDRPYFVILQTLRLNWDVQLVFNCPKHPPVCQGYNLIMWESQNQSAICLISVC